MVLPYESIWLIGAELVVSIPLFPLRSVLFDGGHLPLQVFEPRYLDMVSKSMRGEAPFGVVLIRSGTDSRISRDWRQPDLFDIGTEAHVIDFNQLSNGNLGIIVKGGRKFRILSTESQSDHLLCGEVDYFPIESSSVIGAEHSHLVEILRDLVQHPGVEKLGLSLDLRDSHSVSCILSELLPIEPEIKQKLLEIDEAIERLHELNRIVNKIRG